MREYQANNYGILTSKRNVAWKHSQEIVRSCHQLMEEYLVDTCPSATLKGTNSEAVGPPSPVGVLDAAACSSCDTCSENAIPGSGSQAEPPSSKRPRSSAANVHEP